MERNTEKKIKLIWDFRGPAAAHTAEHHEKHLAEFNVIENRNNHITGFDHLSDVHSIAYLVVDESELREVRDILRPHRGEIFQHQNG